MADGGPRAAETEEKDKVGTEEVEKDETNDRDETESRSSTDSAELVRTNKRKRIEDDEGKQGLFRHLLHSVVLTSELGI